MSGIKDYSTTPANNNASPPNGFPEGMAPASLNDGMRQVMADIRSWYEDPAWINLGDTPTYSSGTVFLVATDLTARYAVGRRIRATGTTPFSVEGTISASSYSSPNTTVTVVWDSGSMDSTLSAVSLNMAQASLDRLDLENCTFDTTTFEGTTTFLGSVVGVFPVGSVIDYAGATAPTNWLLCYGQAISRTTYADLFTAIGTTYGVGDGSTTFNIPDVRGRVIAGQDDMGGSSADRLTNASGGVDGDVLGGTGGSETHTLTEAELAVHYHLAGNRVPNSGATYKRGSAHTVTTFSSPAGLSEASSTEDAGSGDAHNNVQPTIIMNKIIFAGA